MAEQEAHPVSAHYSSDDLGTTILNALRVAGKNPDRVTTDDLAPADQLHTAGKAATLELARLAQLKEGTRVLDVGGGIGGPARTLAEALKCRVTVLDLTEALCRAGELLTTRTNLDQFVTFRQGNALEMPFADQTFEVAWTQHASMNISDKEKLYSEIYRVLAPSGKFAFHDVAAGPNSPVHFPVPWAVQPSISFLRPPEEIRALLLRTGFKEIIWKDTTAESTAWAKERVAPLKNPDFVPPPVGLHLVLGASFRDMFLNLLRNLEENRLSVIEAVFEK